MGAVTTSHAQSTAPPPGAAALSRARTAWDKGDFDVAEPLYKQALDDGGLAPIEVVDAWVHIGAARAVMGKYKPALEAFRHAAVIDSKFTVPTEAGKKAVQIGEMARREKARIGSIKLDADAPSRVKYGQSFEVGATLDAPHVPLVSKIGIFVRDPLSNKTYSSTSPSSVNVRFEVPLGMTMPDAALVVRVDALDAHANRLASAEQRVKVEAQPVAVSTSPILRDTDRTSDRRDRDKDEKKKDSGGGFWSSPWPYVIGGTLLAAGGTAAFFMTRQTDDVNVGGPRLQTAR